MDKTKSISIAAALAFLAAGAAQAQEQNSTTTGTQVQPPAATGGTTTGTDTGAATTTTTPGAATTAPMPSAGDNSDTAQTPPADTSTTTTTAATGGMSGQMFMEMQQSGQWLATDLMGAQVRSSNDEDIGEVNDILFTQDGQGEAIVVGVGGFLGIGEKNVAIPFERLTVTPEDGDAEGDDFIVSLETTKDELNNAPAFRTMDDAENTMSSGATSEGVTPPTGATTTTPDSGMGTTGTGTGTTGTGTSQ